MAIKHLSPKDAEELDKDTPFWEKPEAWKSPLCIPMAIGFIIFFIMMALWYGFKWTILWLLVSWMRPFTNSTWLCKLDFHKWRDTEVDNWEKKQKQMCIVCKKERTVKISA